MNFKKAATIAAAAGALAAISVPAMAFENEFHGSLTVKSFLSNYEQGGGGVPAFSTLGNDNANKSQNLKANNYFEQRARVFYTGKASDDLKMVLGFEIDSVWGDFAQGGYGSRNAANSPASVADSTATRNSGGALEADAVNLETKWVYMDFKIPSTPTRATVGIQAFKDSLKGIFFDFDAAGIMTTTKAGPATVNVGYIRGYDQSFYNISNNGTTNTALNRPRGADNLDIGVIEGKMAVSKDLNVGVSYYLYNDGRGINTAGATTNYLTGAVAAPVNKASSMMLNVFGLNADAKVGPVALSGFAAYQGGIFKDVYGTSDSAYLNAYAANVAAKAAVGLGTLKTALLYTSGDNGAANNRHLTGWIGTSQSPDATWSNTTGTSTYNESGMMLLNRNALSQGTTTDMSIVYNSGNGTTPLNSQGVYLYTLGYDANITPKFFANVNAGFAWVAKTNALKAVRVGSTQNSSNFQGSEINIETGYKMYDNLTAKVQAAYVVLGDYYASTLNTGNGAKTPENPYTARVQLTYTF